MSERLYGDRPISHPNDDAFGLASFADALATSLLQMSPKDGLVISVEGPWGAGKSSAIALALRTIKLRVLIGLGEGRDEVDKLTAEELDGRWAETARKRKTHIVRFNPWNFSGQENLVRAFFTELSVQLNTPKPGWLRRQLDKVSGYLPAFGGAMGAGSGIFVGSAIPGVAAAAGAVGRALGELGQKAFALDHSVEKAKSELTDKLSAADLRVIVLIDDIDRLMPAEMRAIFSLVKSLGDLPRVLYVLAFDESVVKKALTDSAEKIDPEFLEKIVQVSLKLPPPWRSELRQLLFTRLNSIVGEATPADQQRWQRMLTRAIDPYLETPRDVTRLANTLQVIWPNVKGDVDLSDLITITTLQLFDPKVYALIRDEIEVITHAEYRYEDEEKFGERMLPTFASKPDVAKEAMALMFPRLANAWNSFMADGTYYIAQKEQRRICTKEFHRNYFVFGRDTRMLSRAEIEAIVASPDPAPVFAATLKRLVDDPKASQPSRVAALLDQVGAAVYAKPLLTPNLLKAVLDNSDVLIKREDEEWEMFVTSNDRRLASIVNLGVEKLDAAAREVILEVLVSYGAGLQMRAEIVQEDAMRHGYFGGESKHESERLFPADKVKDAALKIRDQIAQSCEDGTVWTAPMPLRLVWSWWRTEGDQRLKDWIASVIADEKLIIRLANDLPGRSYQSGGDDGPRIVWVFNRAEWAKLLDVDLVFARLEALSPGNEQALTTLDRLNEAERANKR